MLMVVWCVFDRCVIDFEHIMVCVDGAMAVLVAAGCGVHVRVVRAGCCVVELRSAWCV